MDFISINPEEAEKEADKLRQVFQGEQLSNNSKNWSTAAFLAEQARLAEAQSTGDVYASLPPFLRLKR